MYALIRSGGKQYRVSPGETIKVERLPGKVGGKVTFPDVLAVHTDERKLLTELAGEKGLSKAQAQELLLEVAGVSSTAELPRARVDEVFEAIKAWDPQQVLA